MSEDIDYRAVTPPDDKSPEEYSWQQRRAEILSLIEEAGHPGALNKSQLARRYGTSPSNIHKDFERLREYYRDNLGEGAKTVSEVVYRKAVREYMDRGEFDKAVDVVESWNDWLFSVGAVEETAHKVEHSGGLENSVDIPDSMKVAIREAFEERR